jgi:uncharacterized protein
MNSAILTESSNDAKTEKAAMIKSLFVAVTVVFLGAAVSPALAQSTGYSVKRPVIGASCKQCPWGALADIIKAAMEGSGYDIQVCYTCAGGAREVRLVSAAAMAPPTPPSMNSTLKMLGITPDSMPPPPHGPVDFGVTTNNYLYWAYHGTGEYKGEPPRTQLRLIANITTPYYLVVAVRAGSGITDLAQLKGRRGSRILWDDRLFPHIAREVLASFGLSPETIRANGGKMLDTLSPVDRRDFDVAIFVADLSGTPEFMVGYEVSARLDLTYLALPQPLLGQIAADYDMIPATLPRGYFRGVTQPVPTIAWTGNAIYGRADMPDDFAYKLAKSLYDRQQLLSWAIEQFAYHPKLVWKVGDVPLHPGAARFYHEIGFMR